MERLEINRKFWKFEGLLVGSIECIRNTSCKVDKIVRMRERV